MNNTADSPPDSPLERETKAKQVFEFNGNRTQIGGGGKRSAACRHHCLSSENEHEISMFPPRPG